MSDKEIAYGLTKAYIEHLNTRINNQGNHSYSNPEQIAKTYLYFLQVVNGSEKVVKSNDGE
ncbi:hypothetical protein [Macrococcoides caseolyticum]|uniref:hypothetical protein n=1 Tax=Macrococcoides caseolyticum TaxID=69966 RepID=UPI0030EEB50E